MALLITTSKNQLLDKKRKDNGGGATRWRIKIQTRSKYGLRVIHGDSASEAANEGSGSVGSIQTRCVDGKIQEKSRNVNDTLKQTEVQIGKEGIGTGSSILARTSPQDDEQLRRPLDITIKLKGSLRRSPRKKLNLVSKNVQEVAVQEDPCNENPNDATPMKTFKMQRPHEDEEGREQGRQSSFTELTEPLIDGNVEDHGMENATEVENMESTRRIHKKRKKTSGKELTKWKNRDIKLAVEIPEHIMRPGVKVPNVDNKSFDIAKDDHSEEAILEMGRMYRTHKHKIHKHFMKFKTKEEDCRIGLRK
ncbi:hypothetical protein FNV43_RR06582 [Rhamnella rubrinervis]|uniref:Uncharacterized protein n=1 Tax=Rhamnella rubrinervis TaxID=2594499 RepID=A0A8K0HE71_9ROSA|nr:hypothetical protein FNV43_RR06582 [Rhamnella rubrinervis]